MRFWGCSIIQTCYLCSMEKIQLILEPGYVGWFAISSEACGCEECRDYSHGETIQDAIDNEMERIQELRASKADPNDDNFVYELEYEWK